MTSLIRIVLVLCMFGLVLTSPIISTAQADSADSPSQSTIIVDDETESDGYFDKFGPSSSWYDSNPSTDITWPLFNPESCGGFPTCLRADHAFYTFAAPNWIGETQNNWAQWVPFLPESGYWEIFAFIPKVSTIDPNTPGDRGARDTKKAQYRIITSNHEYTAVVDQDYWGQTSGWASLGVFDAQVSLNSTNNIPMSVQLRDVTSDYSNQGRMTSVLFDAMKWEKRTSAPSPTPRAVPTQPGGSPPPVPTGFSQMPLSTTSISLMWNDVVGESSYYIEGHNANVEIPANRRSYTVERLEPASQYNYRLHARNSWGESSTDWITASTFGLPKTPTPEPDLVTPVVIVPGYGHTLPFTNRTIVVGKNFIPQGLIDLLTVLEDSNVPAKICVYSWWEPNLVSSNRLHQCISEVGGNAGRPVDIITHSNGGQVARAYLQQYPNPYPVDTLYSIAPPNQGALSAYLIWAGGDLSLEGSYSWSTRAIISLASLSFGSACRYQSDACVQLVMQNMVPSLQDLLPTTPEYLIDKQGLVSHSEAHPNIWLKGLNSNPARLFENTDRVIIHRGVGVPTWDKLHIDSARPGRNGLWSDGTPPWFNRVTQTSGDNRILSLSASIPGLTESNQYDIVDHAGADHGSVIGEAAIDIYRDLGIDVGVLPLKSNEPDDFFSPITGNPWMFTVAGDVVFTLVDSQGQAIAGETISLSDPVATAILLPNVTDQQYSVQIRNIKPNQQQYVLTILSGETATYQQWSAGTLQSMQSKVIEVNPTRFTIHLPHNLTR